MNWTRISPIGDRKCTTANCERSARWHMESGGVGSDYCSRCRDAIDGASLEARLDRYELALHRIAGHVNIAGEKAREIAAEALAT